MQSDNASTQQQRQVNQQKRALQGWPGRRPQRRLLSGHSHQQEEAWHQRTERGRVLLRRNALLALCLQAAWQREEHLLEHVAARAEQYGTNQPQRVREHQVQASQKSYKPANFDHKPLMV